MNSTLEHQITQHRFPKIIYIAGANRSGTTLLDILLSQHPEIFSGGELSRVPRNLHEINMKCTCGVPAELCHFWNGTRTDITELQKRQIAPSYTIKNINKKLENRKNLSYYRKGKKPNRENLQLYLTLQANIISRLWALKPEASFVVDSSKTEEGSACRPLVLRNYCNLQLKIIHLVRDPRGVVASHLKGSNRKLEKGIGAHRPLSGMRALIAWIRTNQFVENIPKFSPGITMIKIYYEELLANPHTTLQKLGNFLSLDFSSVIRVIQEEQIRTPQHMIGGNRMRLGPIKLEVQKGSFQLPWRYQLPCLLSKKIYY